MTKRLTVFVFGVASYAVFFLTYLYAIGFVGNFFVPKSLDAPSQIGFWPALMVNVLLLGIFAVQHSAMARPAFKRVITQVIPEAAERSVYVLASSLALIALFAFWQPMGGVVWHVTNPSARVAINILCGFGFTLVLLTTFLINHFDLFGLRQVYLYLVGKPYTHLEFRTPLLYRYVRHPLYVGWFVAFWAAPTMTVAHLVFTVMCSAYMLKAITWEERDLLAIHGSKYADYRQRVPKLIPSALPYADQKETLRQSKYNVA